MVFVSIDHNNLRLFIDIKNLSFRQVYFAEKLSKDHYRIDDYQGKIYEATNTLTQCCQ